MEAELFQSDEQTDMKLIVAFRNIANAPKKRLPVSTECAVHLIECTTEVQNLDESTASGLSTRTGFRWHTTEFSGGILVNTLTKFG